MKKFLPKMESEEIWLEIETPCEDHFQETIVVAKATDADCASLILYGWDKDKHGGIGTSFYSQIFPDVQEINIIINALETVRNKILGIDYSTDFEKWLT